jgi:hypothetical protein
VTVFRSAALHRPLTNLAQQNGKRGVDWGEQRKTRGVRRRVRSLPTIIIRGDPSPTSRPNVQLCRKQQQLHHRLAEKSRVRSAGRTRRPGAHVFRPVSSAAAGAQGLVPLPVGISRRIATVLYRRHLTGRVTLARNSTDAICLGAVTLGGAEEWRRRVS